MPFKTLRKTEGGLYCDVAMETHLAPIPFSFEPNNAICDPIIRKRPV